jgi:hypothetical protein
MESLLFKAGRAHSRYFSQHSAIGRFWFVGAIQRGRRSARDPRCEPILEYLSVNPPGLTRSAVRTLQSCPYHSPIDVGLGNQIFVAHGSGEVPRQSNVEFRDMDLQAQTREAGDIYGEGIGVEAGLRNVHLKSDSVDGNSATLEILHGIDGVGFLVEPCATVLVIENQRSWIAFVGPAKRLFDIGRVLVRRSDSGLVDQGELENRK